VARPRFYLGAKVMLEKFKSFLTDPYDPDMDAKDWFLFIGFIIVCLMLWRSVFNIIGDYAG
jgi:hypothetical protein